MYVKFSDCSLDKASCDCNLLNITGYTHNTPNGLKIPTIASDLTLHAERETIISATCKALFTTCLSQEFCDGIKPTLQLNITTSDNGFVATIP